MKISRFVVVINGFSGEIFEKCSASRRCSLCPNALVKVGDKYKLDDVIVSEACWKSIVDEKAHIAQMTMHFNRIEFHLTSILNKIMICLLKLSRGVVYRFNFFKYFNIGW